MAEYVSANIYLNVLKTELVVLHPLPRWEASFKTFVKVKKRPQKCRPGPRKSRLLLGLLISIPAPSGAKLVGAGDSQKQFLRTCHVRPVFSNTPSCFLRLVTLVCTIQLTQMLKDRARGLQELCVECTPAGPLCGLT